MVGGERFGLRVNAVTREIGDTQYPFSGGSGGSRTAAAVSPAIRVTCIDALDQLFAKVAPQLGAQPADLAAEGGRVFVKANPSKGLAWKDACKAIGTEPISVHGRWQDGLSSSGTSCVQFAC